MTVTATVTMIIAPFVTLAAVIIAGFVATMLAAALLPILAAILLAVLAPVFMAGFPSVFSTVFLPWCFIRLTRENRADAAYAHHDRQHGRRQFTTHDSRPRWEWQVRALQPVTRAHGTKTFNWTVYSAQPRKAAEIAARPPSSSSTVGQPYPNRKYVSGISNQWPGPT